MGLKLYVLLLMANPNLNADKNLTGKADKEFENSIRPAVIRDFSGQPDQELELQRVSDYDLPAHVLRFTVHGRVRLPS